MFDDDEPDERDQLAVARLFARDGADVPADVVHDFAPGDGRSSALRGGPRACTIRHVVPFTVG
jgi:hypothetical protein